MRSLEHWKKKLWSLLKIVVHVIVQAFVLMRMNWQVRIMLLQHMCAQLYHCLVSPVGKVPVYRAGGSGSIASQTNTQGLQ